MVVIIIIILVLLFAALMYLGFRLFKWIFREKIRVLTFFALTTILGLGTVVNAIFFKKMEFIQSNVYPNLYLVKYPDKDKTILNQAIREKIIDHLGNRYSEGKKLAYDGENGIYFYEYGGRTFGFIGEAGTSYFIDHEEDLGGFVSEELGMYTQYRLAEFYLDNCKNDSITYCGELNYFNEGDFVGVDSLKNISAVHVQLQTQDVK